mmetsp:Transcript_16412/g.33723  ORF Transcript_16412/g.33723 Transcript_16412/m.33723 type:complete len:384 (+) Transcript_16412:470-1621(+)
MFLVEFDSLSGGFGTVKGDTLVVFKGVEGSDSVGSSSDTGNECIGELAIVFLHELFLDLLSDHALEVSDDGGEGVGSDCRTNEVVCVADVGDPVGHGFVDGVLEGALTGLDGDDLGTKRVHSEDVQLLALAIDGTHVHGTVQSKHGTDGGGGNTVLSGTGLGNDAGLADSLGKKGLADGVVDFVGSSVSQILTLQPDFGSTGQFREAFRLVEGSGSTDEFSAVAIEFCQEFGIVLDLVVRLFDFLEGNRKCLGDVLPSEFSEAGLVIGSRPFLGGLTELGSLVFGSIRLLYTTGQVRNDVANGGGLVFRCRIVSEVLHGIQNRTSNYYSIGQVGYAVDHFRRRDSESDGQWEVGCLSDSLDEIIEIGREFRSGTGDTRDRNTV